MVRQKPRRNQVGLWHDDKQPDATVRQRVGGTAGCRPIDLYGNEAQVANDGGTVQAALLRTPAYLLITGGERVTVVR